MISSKKRTTIILTAFTFVFSVIFVLTLILANSTLVKFAQADAETPYAYYYDNLTTVNSDGDEVDYALAKQFYNTLDSIEKSGAFKTGQVSYALDALLTSDQIKGWVEDGDLEIPKAFSAARDSFLMDRPELFYVDMYKLTISASRTSGVYSAFIDSGRNATVYRDNAFTTEAEVNKAISDFNTALTNMKNSVLQKVASDNSGNNRDYLLAIAANEAIATAVNYDFGAYNDYINGVDGASTISLTHTAYGALALNKAVCSGFAFAYKALMDSLDVPCVVVSGYSKGKDNSGNDTESNVGHSWNYVYLQTGSKAAASAEAAAEAEGGWFAFDTTWNSVSQNKNKYSAMDSFTGTAQHIADRVISSSNYQLTYPTLSLMSYEQALNPDSVRDLVRIGGFEFSSIATSQDGEYDYPRQYVSYDGYGAEQLLDKEKLRLVFRQSSLSNGEMVWTKWEDMVNYSLIQGSGIQHTDTKTSTATTSDVRYTQYAVLPAGIEPDLKAIIGDFVLLDKECMYSSSELVENNAVFLSAPIENYAYGTYTPPPYSLTDKSKPYPGLDIDISDRMSGSSDSNIVSDKNAVVITIVYDEPLYRLDENKPIGINFTAERENIRQYAGFVAFDDGAYVHLLKDSNGVANTLQFKFKPSLMYEHNRLGYAFMFENVGSAKIVDKKDESGQLVRTTSDKTPNHVFYRFSRIYRVCPKVFGDGRLWVECCAQPTLVDNSDLSAMDFKDEEGKSTFSEQERSQMMLVVNNVSPDTENDILNGIGNSNSNNVSKDDIKASQTYDIKLSICGKTASIPDGSYVKIALGFPEGYGPDDEGVTFKIFHRKHVKDNEYIIEEIPCVVTKFGIVATVKSFSPYTVVVVPESKATQKTVIATIDGKGGKLSKADGQIQTVSRDGSYTYNIAPDAGYRLYSVTLNGKDLKDRVAEGALTLTYDELTRNNELEIKFISDEAAVRFEENNIVEPVKVVVATDNSAAKYTFVEGEVFSDPTSPLSVGAIVGIVIGVLVFVAAVGALVAVLIIKKKKQQNA